jgi:hypothetical protein
MLANMAYIMIRITRNGVRAIEGKPSTDLDRFKSRLRARFWIPLLLYVALIYAALSWMFYAASPSQGKWVFIFGLAGAFAVSAVTMGIVTVYWLRWMKKLQEGLPLKPEPDSSSSAFEKWNLAYSNKMADKFPHFLGRWLLILVGIVLVAFSLLHAHGLPRPALTT